MKTIKLIKPPPEKADSKYS